MLTAIIPIAARICLVSMISGWQAGSVSSTLCRLPCHTLTSVRAPAECAVLCLCPPAVVVVVVLCPCLPVPPGSCRGCVTVTSSGSVPSPRSCPLAHWHSCTTTARSLKVNTARAQGGARQGHSCRGCVHAGLGVSAGQLALVFGWCAEDWKGLRSVALLH